LKEKKPMSAFVRVLVALLVPAAMVSSEAHASNRVLFTTEILGRVQNVENGLENVRVYLSNRLVAVRSTPVGSSTSVDGSVDTVMHGQERRDIVRRASSGKIVGLESDANGIQLWVSFDSTCTTRDCAWKFINHFNNWRTFGLAALPTRDADGLQLDAMWIGRKPFWWRTMETNPGDKYNSDLYNTIDQSAPDLMLEVKLNELMEVEHKTVRHDGWGS
jgi:hypothetical protein